MWSTLVLLNIVTCKVCTCRMNSPKEPSFVRSTSHGPRYGNGCWTEEAFLRTTLKQKDRISRLR